MPDWGSPELALGQRQFFEVLQAFCDQLPAVQGRVFMMCEWLDLDTDEICKEMQTTPTNLWVLLHRARLRLRLRQSESPRIRRLRESRGPGRRHPVQDGRWLFDASQPPGSTT